MELLLSFIPNPPTSSSSPLLCHHCSHLCYFQPKIKTKSFHGLFLSFRSVKASAEPTTKRIHHVETPPPFNKPSVEGSSFNTALNDADLPVWDKVGALVRLTYGIGIYGAMAVAGGFICSITGIDAMGGFHLSSDCILQGLGYAVPPIMALLFILDDEVVKLSPHARAIRDVEDEELWSFFYGMSPWQFILMVAASSVGEELFYRAAVQGALADIFLRGSNLMAGARGMASLAYAAVLTAVLTSSLYYMAASPKDPNYVVAPVLNSHPNRQDFKKLFEAWYEKRQMRKIYSPLLEGLLALYLGFEWVQTNNILAPIITHGIYSTVILGHGLVKIHHHRLRLRRRVHQLRLEERNEV
ncbi:uncharacterized protein LOC129322258 isoform X2 [Prosopis cineraria]|uniref:uncharacterized protein LOC129322258 isoform X2 n=1 Tax=Prosopis cineraria TaxID=364024 RepID=UPI002410576D|nr:uncharacterized protein LOC129322258 isoform X2 [Prosopis cineraria]